MQNASAMLGAVTVLPETFLVLAFRNKGAGALCHEGAKLPCFCLPAHVNFICRVGALPGQEAKQGFCESGI